MSKSQPAAVPDTNLKAGQFYGQVSRSSRRSGLVMSSLSHTEPKQIPPHSHELAFFCVLLDGDYREQCGRRLIEYQPFTSVFHPPGMAHQDEIGPRGAHFFSVEMERCWFDLLRQNGPLSEPSPDIQGGEMMWLAMRLYWQHQLGDDSSPLAVECLAAELLASVMRLRESPERHAPSWLARVADCLREQYHRKLTLADLAHEAGVHPVHLSRVFRRHYRQSLGECVQRLRVLAACRRLRDPEARLADISAATGFTDQSHLTRIFKTITGTTPGAFRAAMRAG